MVAVVYRPPNTTQCQFEDIIKRLHNTLENLPDPNAEFLLCGDFNFPHVNWESLEVTGGTTEEKEHARKLIALAENKYLTQFINKPTRRSNILDLLFSNNHGIIHKYEPFQTNIPDHKTCEATLKINALMNTVPQKKCKAQTEMAKLNFYHIDILTWYSYLIGSPRTKLDQLAYTYYSNKGGPSRTTGTPVQHII